LAVPLVSFPSSPPCRLVVFPISSTFPFPDPAPSAIYTLSLHDALPICRGRFADPEALARTIQKAVRASYRLNQVVANSVDTVLSDRKSTRLNSSHVSISYAVFCLKKKKKHI